MNDLMRVLLVEDDDAHAELIMRALAVSSVPSSVRHVKDGETAVACLIGTSNGGPRGELPDIVILDLRLPGIDGFEVLRRLRASEASRKMPVVILTGSRSEKDAATALEYDVVGYLIKPIELAALVERLRDLGQVLRNFIRNV